MICVSFMLGGHCRAWGVQGPGSRVQGLGSKVQGPGSRVQDLGSRVQGPGSRVQGAGSRVQGPGSRVQGPGSRVQDAGHRIECDGYQGLTCEDTRVAPGRVDCPPTSMKSAPSATMRRASATTWGCTDERLGVGAWNVCGMCVGCGV